MPKVSEMYKNNEVQIWIKNEQNDVICTRSLSRYAETVIRTEAPRIQCIPPGVEGIVLFWLKIKHDLLNRLSLNSTFFLKLKSVTTHKKTWTCEPLTAMSSSQLMATHVTGLSWPYRVCRGVRFNSCATPPWWVIPHRRHVVSRDPVIRWWPSSSNEMQVITSVNRIKVYYKINLTNYRPFLLVLRRYFMHTMDTCMSHNSGLLSSLCTENSETVVPVSSGYQ